MKVKQVLCWIWSVENKGIPVFVSIALVLLIWVIISTVFFPSDVKEEEINAPRIIAARAVCKEIPVPDNFKHLNTSWNQRTGGKQANYSNTYKTDLSFDEILNYYKITLNEKGFSGGNWVDSVSERQISFGKNNINVIIAYKTRKTNLWEYFKKDDWNVYIWCDDRKHF